MSARPNMQSQAAAAAAVAATNTGSANGIAYKLQSSPVTGVTPQYQQPQQSPKPQHQVGGTQQIPQSQQAQSQAQISSQVPSPRAPQIQSQSNQIPSQVPSQVPSQAPAQSSSSSNGGGQVVGLHYKIGKKIGEGSFGVIFEGTNLINGIPVAIKFEPRKTEAPQLRDEYRTYMHLIGVPGIPTAYYFGQEGLHNILVIDLLGPSLEDLFDWCGRKFSVKTVVQVAVQMITLIQGVHEHDLIYRDIKPDNFLIGRRGMPDENMVHMVDFGMAKRYRDARTKKHIPYREKKSLSGTARYMSVNTHLGREQSRRDDMEALGHVFFYFLRGQLPWQGLKAPTNKQKYEKIGEKKRSTAISDLCQGFPPQFGEYLRRVRDLQFEEEPDYEGYRKLIFSVLDDIGATADGHYDWMDLNGGRGWDYSINKKPNLHGYGHPNPPHRHQQRRTRSNQQYYQQPHHHSHQALAQQAQQAAAGQLPSQSPQYHHHQQNGVGDRPLPNLPDKDDRYGSHGDISAAGRQLQQQQQQISSRYDQHDLRQQQPQTVSDPVKAAQQQKPQPDQLSSKSGKGLFKCFPCC
ncbi:DEKNAAC101717 [Brettanomyces naardenensis]|uniref:non-specific serine/threonine protein kinase n=1 Tax=Brettanomyces naardenensis TaxID=13370 RepID=A0A448YIR0_BRENA|nr:DEKNAAC101717 [Brettanomyces naardenensis]